MITHVALCGPADPNEIFLNRTGLVFPISPGGIPVNLLAKALIRKGLRVSVISISATVTENWTHSEGLLTMYLMPQRKRARSVGLDFFKVERNAMFEILDKLDVDIIHAHWTYEFALAALATKKPVLVTAHDAPLTIFKLMLDPYRFLRLIMAYSVRFKTKNLTVVSPYLSYRWRREMFWKGEVAIIPNISPYSNAPTKQNTEIASRILTVSDSGKLKNIKTLLQAWQIVLDRVPIAQLNLVGYGLGKDDDLARWATKKGLNNSIVWSGYKDRNFISKMLTNADVFVTPSLEESFGLTVLEAMEHEVPVIGGACSGGIPFVMADSGMLVDVKRPTEIAEAIIRLLEDKELRLSFGIRGRIRARGVFSADLIVKDYIEEYKRILGVINV